MAGETPLTIIGNLTNDPELQVHPGRRRRRELHGCVDPAHVRQAVERVAWTARRCSCAARCGGRQRRTSPSPSPAVPGSSCPAASSSRSYDTKEGEKRTVVELEVDEVGPSLRYATAKVSKTTRGGGGGGFGGGGGGFGGGGPQGRTDDPWASPPAGGGAPDEPPF
jgi:single-strand DNA-binding protein